MPERTLTILKPDLLAARKQGEALQHLLDEGFDIVAMRQTILSRQQAEAFYAVHKERPFFPDLIEFMTSGPVVVACLERDNAVSRLREVMGPTDSKQAPGNTLRGKFGTDIQYNAVHGSDSQENARREVSFFFPHLD